MNVELLEQQEPSSLLVWPRSEKSLQSRIMTDPEYCEIDVTARATLEKRTVVIGSGMHPCATIVRRW